MIKFPANHLSESFLLASLHDWLTCYECEPVSQKSNLATIGQLQRLIIILNQSKDLSKKLEGSEPIVRQINVFRTCVTNNMAATWNQIRSLDPRRSKVE